MENKGTFCLIGWVGFMVMLVLFMEKCNCKDCGSVTEKTVTIRKNVWDTVTKKIAVPYPVKSDSVIVEVPAKVDTAAILKRYFNVYYYCQTIADTNLRATIEDSVTKNSIVNRTFKYQWLKPTQITTVNTTPVKIPEDRMALYPGIFAGSSTIGDKLGFGIELMLKTKKERIYGIGYDLLQRRIEARASMKIHFGK